MPGEWEPAPRRPLRRDEKWIVALLGALVFGAFFADLAASYRPGTWSVLFILLAWGPLLVLHELGHALAAKLVGWNVHEVVIGFGREVLRFRVGTTRVRIKRIPFEGFVVPVPTSLRWARLKNAIVFVAGPGIEASFLLVIGVLVGFEQLFSASDDLSIILAQSVAAAIGIGLFFNLVPHVTSDGRVSDGLGVLSSPFLPREHFVEVAALPYVARARQRLDVDDPSEALAIVERALERFPENDPLRAFRAVCLAANGDADAARDALEALGVGGLLSSSEDHDVSRRAALLHAVGLVALEALEADLLRDGELAVERAVALVPQSREYMVTLGALLVERRRYNEAVTLLERALSGGNDTEEEGRCRAYLALAAHRTGDATAAARHLEALRQTDVHPRLTRRVRAEIDLPDCSGGASSTTSPGDMPFR